MSYETSERKGVLKSTAVNVLCPEFDNRFQSWLSEALGFESENVIPNYKELATTYSTEGRNYAFFEFNSIEYDGTPSTESEDDETSTQRYDATIKCRITLVGKCSRERAMFLHDLIFLSQNVYELEALGLGPTDAEIIQFGTIQEATRRTITATVDMTFSYVYKRTWEIKRISEAPVEFVSSSKKGN